MTIFACESQQKSFFIFPKAQSLLSQRKNLGLYDFFSVIVNVFNSSCDSALNNFMVNPVKIFGFSSKKWEN